MADIARLQIAVEPKGVSEATSALKGMSNAAGLVEGALKRLAAAWATFKVAEQAKESAMLAARYQTLGIVMQTLGNNAGYTGAQMVEFQKSLMATGISAIESRNTLNMMASAQMDLTKSSQLARVAQDAAVVGNLNSSEAFQRMIYGIQSGQTEILRTIGINVNFENSYKALAKELKKNVAELTEHEKVQARTNVVMEKGKDIAGAYEASMGTAGKQLASTKRYVDDLKVGLGTVFLPGMTESVKVYTEALKAAGQWTQANQLRLASLGVTMAATTGATVDLGRAIIGLGVDATKGADGISISQKLIEGWGFSAAVVADLFNGLRLQVKNLTTDSLDQLSFILSAWSKAAYTVGLNKIGTNLGTAAAGAGVGANQSRKEADKASTEEMAVERFERRIRESQSNARKLLQEVDAFRDKLKGKAGAAGGSATSEAAEAMLKRQSQALQALMGDLNALTLGEDMLLKIRVAQMNLTGAAEKQAQAYVQQIINVRELNREEKEREERINRMMAAKLADPITPGIQNSLQAMTDDYRDGINRRYNPEGYAQAELNRLMANRSQFDPQTYIRAFRDLSAQASETWYLIEEGASSAANTMADAFAQFAMSGELSVKRMTQAILTDLIRLTSQSAFRQLLNIGMDALGGMVGGAGGSGGSTGKASSGNIKFANNTGGPGMGGMTVNVAVNNQGATVDAQGGGALGKRLGEAMRAAAMDVLRSESNPGGFLYKRGTA